MKGRRGRLAVLLVLLAALVGGAWLGVSALFDDESELLFERFWVTEPPEQEREFAYDMFLSKAWDLGFFARSSMFRSEEELVEFEADGRTLQLEFPQTGRRVRLSYEVRRCTDHPPYELCLELSENPWGGPRQFYSFGDADEASRRLRRRRPSDRALGR